MLPYVYGPWWSPAGSRQINFLRSSETKLSIVAMVDQQWPDVWHVVPQEASSFQSSAVLTLV